MECPPAGGDQSENANARRCARRHQDRRSYTNRTHRVTSTAVLTVKTFERRSFRQLIVKPRRTDDTMTFGPGELGNPGSGPPILPCVLPYRCRRFGVVQSSASVGNDTASNEQRAVSA